MAEEKKGKKKYLLLLALLGLGGLAVAVSGKKTIPPISGCTNPSATNYNPLATVDDGSCVYPPGAVLGCTDPLALNFNPLATINDGSCTYHPGAILGCTEINATNYNPLATVDDGSCLFAHKECFGGECLVVDGPGPNECDDDSGCAVPQICVPGTYQNIITCPAPNEDIVLELDVCDGDGLSYTHIDTGQSCPQYCPITVKGRVWNETKCSNSTTKGFWGSKRVVLLTSKGNYETYTDESKFEFKDIEIIDGETVTVLVPGEGIYPDKTFTKQMTCGEIWNVGEVWNPAKPDQCQYMLVGETCVKFTKEEQLCWNPALNGCPDYTCDVTVKGKVLKENGDIFPNAEITIDWGSGFKDEYVADGNGNFEIAFTKDCLSKLFSVHIEGQVILLKSSSCGLVDLGDVFICESCNYKVTINTSPQIVAKGGNVTLTITVKNNMPCKGGAGIYDVFGSGSEIVASAIDPYATEVFTFTGTKPVSGVWNTYFKMVRCGYIFTYNFKVE